MPGAEISNIKGAFIGGELHITDYNGVDLMVIGATTGVRTVPAGTVLQVTTAATMTLTYSGRIINSMVDGTIITLPAIASTTLGINYTIVNTASSGNASIIVLAGATTNVFVGCGFSSTSVAYQLTNTKATAKPGDSLRIASICDPVNTAAIWSIMGLTGTWVSTT
jgi:hypothetical protein